jgi:hypothetical protein
MSFGVTGLQLVKELKRCAWLPDSRDEQLRKVATEICTLDDMFNRGKQRHADEYGEDAPLEQQDMAALLFHWHAILRNKRCALAYLHERLKRIQSIWWGTGSAAALPEETLTSASETEKTFIRGYDALMGEYMAAVDVDLHMDLQPPKGLLIECRVLENAGTVQTDSGVFTLEKNTTVFMKRRDAELLIRQGILEHLSG